MFTVGIDPGSSGAIAVLDSLNPDSIALLDLKKHSIFEVKSWLTPYLYTNSQLIKNKIWVEDVHSMHGISAKSNFGFGRNLGIVLTIAEMLTEIAPNMVTPKIWQKYIGIAVKGKPIKEEVAKIEKEFEGSVSYPWHLIEALRYIKAELEKLK